MVLHLWHVARRFVASAAGAVTVDWLVLAAAVIGMVMIFLDPIATGTETLAESVADSIAGVPVGTAGD
jgi:hypothetical protein